MTLETGRKYDLDTLHFTGWTAGDGSETIGYNIADYFGPDGTYKGPDTCGIEPTFRLTPVSQNS